MQYQLVLQFPGKLIKHHDLMKIEDDFIEIIKEGDVDGHDIGSDEVNFFILTDNPEEAFRSLKPYLIDEGLLTFLKSAYRKTDEEKFIILYPPTLQKFTVQ